MPSTKKIRYSTKAKKDLKRCRNDVKLMAELYKVLEKLANGEELAEKYKKHSLRGQYEGCFECHVLSDFLLIWIDDITDTIEVVRIGSHSELFG